ncbi:hypothetical protein TWF594_003544 [Orbilia oligospora]|nr:hypothetical protein TWF594_003544 [Orbilia oligospora]
MSDTRSIAIPLALSQLIHLAAAQFATGFSYTQFETTPLATYSFVGSLTNFNPPADCTSGDLWTVNTEPLTITDGSTKQYIGSYFSAGCYSGGPSSCCPSSWRDTAYYTSTGGSCPPGYSRMPSVTEPIYTSGSIYYYPVISLQSGSSLAFPCCPTVSYTHTMAERITGVLLPRAMLTSTLTISSTRGYIQILCNYLQDDNLEVYTESSTHYSIYYRYLANPIYIFDSDATQTSASTTIQTSTTSGSQPSSTPASPGTSVASSAGGPSNTAPPPPPDAEQSSEKKSGLSTGAIAGIAVGVGVPIILVAIYLTYRLTRRKSEPVSSGSMWGNSGKIEVGAMEPGIMENPAEYGGINAAGGGNKAYN